jgi:glycosyltransferase involved in cell wall biosynthesis
MLWDKGVREFVEAASILRAQGVDARFALVGDSDAENPAAIAPSVLESWRRSGVIEWWGHRTDMHEVFGESHIVCLPSYREGLPKALIEAAACGRPIVTTDAPGCREIVHHGDNGLLVPVRDSHALAEALRKLIESPPTRRHMGALGRTLAENGFAVEQVVQQTLDLYSELLGLHACS